MLYQNGNTLGNNGIQTQGQIDFAKALKPGDRVQYTGEHKLMLRDHKLAHKNDDDIGTVTYGGLPNGVFVIGWDRGEKGMVHTTCLERAPAN